jgi:teichuronic acid exporter
LQHDITANSLKSQTIHALSRSFLESVGLQGVRFIIGIVLARLLFPEQFGLIGMLMIFMAVAQTMIDGGFGAALIQKHGAPQTDTHSVFAAV